MYAMGVLITNSYVVYRKEQDAANVPRNSRLTHYQFLLSIATAWIDKEETDIRTIQRQKKTRQQAKKKNAAPTTPQCQPTAKKVCTRSEAKASACVSPVQDQKAPRVNDKTLHPENGSLRLRLDHYGVFHCAIAPHSKRPACQLHRWAIGREIGSHGQMRDNIVCCSACHVNLCPQCFKTFHTVADLPSNKDIVAKSVH